MLKAVRLFLLLVGLGATAYLIWTHGPRIGEALGRVGWRFLPYLGVTGVIQALDTLGWRFLWVPRLPRVPFGRLFAVRLAGEAVNKVTPLASLGGEPLKAYLLARDGASTPDALASVLVAKNAITLAQIAFLLIGLAIAAGPGLPAAKAALWGFALFPVLILLTIGGVALADLRFRRPSEAPPPADLSAGPSLGKRLGLGAAVALWAVVANSIRANPRGFGLSLAAFFLGWAAGSLEMLAGAYALGFQLSFRDAFVLETLLIAINMATFMIPANAGTQEGGFVLAAGMLGLGAPHGLALAVLRRCRDVFWVAFGLLYLSLSEGRILFRPPELSEVKG